MKKKITKNNIITILLIIAVSFFIAGQLSPISYFINSEFQSQTNPYWDNEFEWKQSTYFLFDHVYLCDNSYIAFDVKPILQDMIFLFHIFPIALSYDERPSTYNVDYFKTSPYANIQMRYMSNVFMVTCFIICLFILYYLVKFFRDLNKKPTKIPFFLGISYLLVIIMIHAATIILIYSTGLGRFGAANYVKIGLGFYYHLVVVIILFLIYFIQNKPKFFKKI